MSFTNISFGFSVIDQVAKIATAPMDAHLMVVHPERWFEKLAKDGVQMCSFHWEAAVRKTSRYIGQLHALGMKAGVAINPDVPVFLKPIMPIIEVFSALMKPVSLTIRLFANMLAGHIMILCMVCIIFIMAKYGAVLTGSMTVVSVLFGIFLDALECLVAFIQAYVFTMLSSIYIGLARAHGD